MENIAHHPRVMLVTGGAGFIGCNFVRQALAEFPETRVAVLDALTYAGSLQNLAGLDGQYGKRYAFHKADLRSLDEVRRVMAAEKPDTIVHFAAESHVDRSIDGPMAFVETNVTGTAHLLVAAREIWTSDGSIRKDVRFHHVSTDEVYGDLPLDRPDLLFTEETPIHASSPYSACKAGSDLLALAYCRTFKLPVSISRCSNNYGPYQFPEKMIPLMISRALMDQPLPVYGKGENIRDWLHVDDHCRAIDMVLRTGRVGEVYNVGGHNERTNLQVVKLILSVLGKPESLISYVTDRPGHDMRYAIDPAKIHSELGWLPEIMFEDGIRTAIQWNVEHKDWIDDILAGEYQSYYETMYGGR